MRTALTVTAAAVALSWLAAPGVAHAGGPYVVTGTATSPVLGTFDMLVQWPGPPFTFGLVPGLGVAHVQLWEPSLGLLVHVNRVPSIETFGPEVVEPPCLFVLPEFRLDSVTPGELHLSGVHAHDDCTGQTNAIFKGLYLFETFALDLQTG